VQIGPEVQQPYADAALRVMKKHKVVINTIPPMPGILRCSLRWWMPPRRKDIGVAEYQNNPEWMEVDLEQPN